MYIIRNIYIYIHEWINEGSVRTSWRTHQASFRKTNWWITLMGNTKVTIRILRTQMHFVGNISLSVLNLAVRILTTRLWGVKEVSAFPYGYTSLTPTKDLCINACNCDKSCVTGMCFFVLNGSGSLLHSLTLAVAVGGEGLEVCNGV